MKLKKIIAAMSALFVILSAQAQEMFNEVSYSPEQTVFKLNAPSSAKKVLLRIYDEGTGSKPIEILKLRQAGVNIWSKTVKQNLAGKFYTFDIGKGETPGTFAKAVGVNGRRGAILNMESTNPYGWQNDHHLKVRNFANLVIYELHYRDFSIDPSSGLVHKGKFLALSEMKATDYLRRLGVNAVHVLPSFDFQSVDETKLNIPQYNWGYDPVNYNVPEGSYSTNPYDPATRIREFKKMVMALHRAGIRVILDVVYNHTFDLENSNFQRTFPDAYYRFTKDGKPSDGSGCGNETASEKPLMHEFMLESVKYWIKEYHIDGFRFDLMGVHDVATMNDIRKEVDAIDPTIFIYGEGWSAGKCAYPESKLAVKANLPEMPGIAAFSDDMRDALRGPYDDDHKGAFLAGIPGEEESLKFGIVGGIAHPQVDMSKVNYDKKPWALQPTQQISYVSCHDDMCLVDRLKASIPNITEDELIRLDELAQTAVLTSQGVPFMLSGEEMLRTKQGIHNSFNSPDSINHLDWNNLDKYPQVFDYYRDLIQLRKDHPAFRLGFADRVRASLVFLPVRPGFVGFVLKNHAGDDNWNNIYVLLNANKSPVKVSLPKANYTVVCNAGIIDQNGMEDFTDDHVIVTGQTGMILHD